MFSCAFISGAPSMLSDGHRSLEALQHHTNSGPPPAAGTASPLELLLSGRYHRCFPKDCTALNLLSATDKGLLRRDFTESLTPCRPTHHKPLLRVCVCGVSNLGIR